ncbi:MAG TPA: hypothetical protein VFF88_00455 [Methylocella sp.]|nr:hypothetical protein [Methylocella sp.]
MPRWTEPIRRPPDVHFRIEGQETFYVSGPSRFNDMLAQPYAASSHFTGINRACRFN